MEESDVKAIRSLMKDGLDIMAIASRLQVSLDYAKEGMDIVAANKKRTKDLWSKLSQII